MIPVVEKLLQKGLSKYRIAQCCGVSWGTVWNWVNEFCEPNDKNILSLLELLKQNGKLPDKKIKAAIKKRKNDAPELIIGLLEKGYSKYAIAKRCNVRWNTVQCWAKGKFIPMPEKFAILESLKL